MKTARARPALRLAVSMVAFALAAPARVAAAADPVAEATFQEGLALLSSARFEEACRLLAASHRREPKSGTLVVLASCHAELGKTATAWAEYKEAAALARAEGRGAHADKANELAAALATRLATVRLDVVGPQPAGFQVSIDDAPMPDGAFAIPLPVDPGEHEVTASAPGRRTFRHRFTLGSGERLVVAIPELDLARAPTAAALAPQAAPSRPDTSETPPHAPAWPWIVGGAGIVSLAASAAALAVSVSASAELDDVCSEARNLCPLDYDEGPARTAELAGFGLFVGFGIAGLAGVSTAAATLLTRPDAGARVSASPAHARLDVTMRF